MPWGSGIMEFWNIGFGGMRSDFIGLTEIKKIKIDPHPFMIRYIQYSIFPFLQRRIFDIPLFHGLSDGPNHPSGLKAKPGPLGQDSSLFESTIRAAAGYVWQQSRIRRVEFT